MNTVTINSNDYIGSDANVTESADLIANEATRQLKTGARVVVSVKGVRGVSSSFFNVIFAAVSEVLGSNPDRFSVTTDTATQRMIFQRSWDAFFKSRA
jgi:hypothetical protein